jgi:hypothetical protein
LNYAARDCVELYISVVPAKFAPSIEGSLRMGAIFFNDCCYAAHNLALAVHRCRDALATTHPILQACAGLADFVPRLRELGELRLTRHLDAQIRVLTTLITRISLSTDDGDRRPVLSRGLRFVPTFGVDAGLRRLVGAPPGAPAPDAPHAERNSEERAAAVVQHLVRVAAQWQVPLNTTSFFLFILLKCYN